MKKEIQVLGGDLILGRQFINGTAAVGEILILALHKIN